MVAQKENSELGLESPQALGCFGASLYPSFEELKC